MTILSVVLSGLEVHEVQHLAGLARTLRLFLDFFGLIWPLLGPGRVLK